MDQTRPPQWGSRWLRRWTTLLCLVALPLATASAAPPGRRVTVWVTSMPEKIPANAPVPPNPERMARISAARNEFEAFQIVVSGFASGVHAAATPLTGPAPADVISEVRLYQEALIEIAQPSSLDGMTGRLPDALIPERDEIVGEARNAFPFDVAPGESRAIWVEVFVPETAAPGIYRGEVKVSFFGKVRAVIPVELTVWDFALPSTSSVRSAFGLSFGALPAGHGIDPNDLAGLATLRARYGQFALDHRITLSRHDDGLFGDFGHFEAYYGPLMRGTAPTRLRGAHLTAVEYLGPLTDVPNLRRWAEHYRANGWFDRLFQYTCDEPPNERCGWADIVARAGAAKEADPEFRTLVTTTIQEADRNNVGPYIDLLVPIVNAMDDKAGIYAGNQRPFYDPFLASDPLNELWMYQACLSHGCGG
ncbi:MAG TPA: hypothetical protein VE782_08455, partial [Myxococcaceae bacterium]|nr:hypothetical protein [Myxococcaceae bacterium]